MHPILPLSALGRRIMINGPSNAGKSTLADAISRKLGVPAIHLDLFSHLPNTDWEPRNTKEFHALHEAAILDEEWVMDGNYSAIMPQRYARATGVIIIDDHFLKRYVRYFRRTLFESNRVGSVAGGRDSIKWEMIAFIWKSRNAGKYRQMAAGYDLPVVICNSLGELQQLYAAWSLERRR